MPKVCADGLLLDAVSPACPVLNQETIESTRLFQTLPTRIVKVKLLFSEIFVFFNIRTLVILYHLKSFFHQPVSCKFN